MRMMRGIVILGLMLSLPALAVFGDVDGLLNLLRANVNQQVAASVKPIDDVTQPAPTRQPGLSPPEQNNGPLGDDPDSVYPTFKPKMTPRKDDDPSVGGKRLRPAIYRPLADGDAPPIRRVAAQAQDQPLSTRESTADVLDDIGRQLQALGAQRYRMEEASGDAHFICEFPAADASARPIVFQSRSPDRAEAMRYVLQQARAWDRGVTR